jgi:hypothetical protein
MGNQRKWEEAVNREDEQGAMGPAGQWLGQGCHAAAWVWGEGRAAPGGLQGHVGWAAGSWAVEAHGVGSWAAGAG